MAGLPHRGGPVGGAVKGAHQVDLHHVVEHLGTVRLPLPVHRGHRRPDPRRVDHAVQAPEPCHRVRDGGLHVALVRDVHLAEEHARRIREIGRDHVVGEVVVAVKEGHVRALRVEELGGGEPEPGDAASDDVGLACAIRHWDGRKRWLHAGRRRHVLERTRRARLGSRG